MADDDHEQWGQVNTTLLLLLLLLLTCCVSNFAEQTGQPKLLTLLHPYLPKCYHSSPCKRLRHAQQCLLQRHWQQRVGVGQRVQLAVGASVAEQGGIVRGKEAGL